MAEIPQRAVLTPNWQAFTERLGQQLWPQPALYVVATPIGNLMDLSLRAWYGLRLADVIAAEDTRSSRALLQAWEIDTPLIAAHRHNERQATEEVLKRLGQGQRVALISDAGTPAISDPGGHLIQSVRQAGFGVVALPGPSALATALMVTGVSTDEQPAFGFLGFLPARQGARKRALAPWLGFEGALVMYEAPHRIVALMQDLSAVFGGHRQVSLARELTKRFEQTVSLSLTQSLAWLAADRHREQGEFVVILHPLAPSQQPQEDDDDQWRDPQRQAWMGALLSALSTRDAAKVMSQALGQSKDICYRQLLVHSGRGDTRSDAQ